MSTTSIIYLMIAILVLILIFSTNFIKLIFKIAIKSFIGCLIIFIANSLLQKFNIYVDINLFTAIFSGIFGIPGIICLYILKIIL